MPACSSSRSVRSISIAFSARFHSSAGQLLFGQRLLHQLGPQLFPLLGRQVAPGWVDLGPRAGADQVKFQAKAAAQFAGDRRRDARARRSPARVGRGWAWCRGPLRPASARRQSRSDCLVRSQSRRSRRWPAAHATTRSPPRRPVAAWHVDHFGTEGPVGRVAELDAKGLDEPGDLPRFPAFRRGRRSQNRRPWPWRPRPRLAQPSWLRSPARTSAGTRGRGASRRVVAARPRPVHSTLAVACASSDVTRKRCGGVCLPELVEAWPASFDIVRQR